MALMIPDAPVSDSSSRAEARMYRALKDGLPDSFRVFHSVAYIVAPGYGSSQHGEVDFLILHPELGVLALEVKGGLISYDGHKKAWFSKDKYGHVHPLRCPFEQGTKAIKAVVGKFKELDIFGLQRNEWLHGNAVAFPDCEYAHTVALPNAPRNIIIDGSEMGNVGQRIPDIMKFWKNQRAHCKPLSATDIEIICRHSLAPSFQLASTIRSEILWHESRLLQLTDEQRLCLDFLELNPRARVSGPAGSGKTVIACEHAVRLARQGLRVLLLCFNEPLGAHLARTVGGMNTGKGSIWAGAYHQLSREWSQKAGLPFSPPDDDDSERCAVFYGETTSILLMDAIEKGAGQFDAVIVDEAQDMTENWWQAIPSALVAPDHCPFVVFVDMNQNIYQRPDASPVRAPVFPLSQNCRNSVPIGEFCAGLVNKTMRFSALNGGGETPKPASYTTDDSQLKQIAGRIESLLSEGVAPEEIVILGTHTLLRSVFGRTGADSVAGCRIAPLDVSAAREPGALSYSTLHRFKGLESDIVIICDADGNERTSTLRHLYVAATRARRRLFIYRKKGVALTAE